PASASGEGRVAAARPTSRSAGRVALPTAKAKAPFVGWPSTADDAVHHTRYPPSPIGWSETLSPFGSPDGARSFLSTRFPATSRTASSLPLGSGCSLNSTRTSVGGFTSRASDEGVDRT